MPGSRRPRLAAVSLFLLTVGPAAAAGAGDATLFAAWPSPSDTWARGYGATLSSTWFQVVNLEAEAARIPAQTLDGNMTSFTGSALLAPPIGFLTPYGGVGVGLFRQTLGSASDTGVLHVTILGAKVKLGLLVVKGEYRRVSLSGTPLLLMNHRVSLGAGVSF
ncbi:MAG: hypothetical protein DMF80_13730 [Acidobacteria bacterium]|nr:MAG: hypothetical protein DMF80_13730 [Acidobacteriota bacterium]